MSVPRPHIVAHRGLHGPGVPENSHAAFRAAWRSGIEWCECDVRTDHAGFPYILHDDTLGRTTSGTGPIGAMTWPQLADLRLRDATGRVTDERLPTLDAVAGYMSAGMALLVEAKVPLTFLNDHHVFGTLYRRHVRWALQSFDRAFIESVPQRRRFGKEYQVRTALLVGQAEMSPGVSATTADAVHVEHVALDADGVALLRQAGKRVGAWTVNGEADLRRVIGLGVDVVITDEPLLARNIVDELV